MMLKTGQQIIWFNCGDFMTDYKFGTWYPIESAPKDGTLILILQNGEMFTASWGARLGFATELHWLSNGCIDNWTSFDASSHWTPLPPPPEENGGINITDLTLNILEDNDK